MRTSIKTDDFKQTFQEYHHTARRLEPRDRYNVGDEVDRTKQYLSGVLMDYSFLNHWNSIVRANRDEGRLMQRVRIVTEPLTDHIRYLIHAGRFNCVAGEDIRYLPRTKAHDLNVQDNEDVWIFDASWAAVIQFNEDDQIIGYEREDDPTEILQWLQHWDTAWHYAITRDEFAALHGVE